MEEICVHTVKMLLVLCFHNCGVDVLYRTLCQPLIWIWSYQHNLYSYKTSIDIKVVKSDEHVRYGGKDSLFIGLINVFIALCHTSYFKRRGLNTESNI
jgi:hypothetical protein